MLAYKNDPKLKKEFLAEIKKHQKADQFIKGTYGRTKGKFKGCAVGCSLDSLNKLNKKTDAVNNHERYETELGIPATIAHLEDAIFEGLPDKLSQQWPLRFSSAIQVGADLSLVTPKFMVWLMGDLEQYAQDDKNVLKVLRHVSKLYQRVIEGDKVKDSEWEKAAAEAARAAEAAEAAWAARAAWGAARAAWGAAEAAEAAARAAARAAAWAAAEAAEYEKMADKLIELLESS